jgi:hypothetical protein
MDDQITALQKAVREAVQRVLELKYQDRYTLLGGSGTEDGEGDGKPAGTFRNSALVVDFDETALGFKRFGKAVRECAEAALLAIQRFERR